MIEYYKLRQAAEDRVRELNERSFTASFYRGYRHWVVKWNENNNEKAVDNEV